MIIDTPLLGIILTILLAVIGVAVTMGMYGEKIKQNREKIKENKELTDKEITNLRDENRQDHKAIFSKLDAIIRNGSK